MNKENFKKDVSDEEIAFLMKPHIEKLKGFTIRYRRLKGAEQEENNKTTKKTEEKKQQNKEEGLSQEDREYSESIVEKPNLSITQRRDFLGLSTYRNDQRKKALIEKGLVEEFSLNLGFQTRGNVKLLELTEKGYQALGKKAPGKRKFPCSAEHWWWQRNIHAFYRKQGFEAEIEKEMNGIRADVAFQKGEGWIAVEVGLSPKNEPVNARQDLEAGFSQVLLALKDSKVKVAVEKRVSEFLPEEMLKRVKLILLSDFSFVREMFGKKD